MTAFDLFQRATCQIAEGNRPAALLSIRKAIKRKFRDLPISMAQSVNSKETAA